MSISLLVVGRYMCMMYNIFFLIFYIIYLISIIRLFSFLCLARIIYATVPVYLSIYEEDALFPYAANKTKAKQSKNRWGEQEQEQEEERTKCKDNRKKSDG